MKNKIQLETTSMSLHIMAMLCMLCDHLWGTIVPGNDWLTCVGRLAFPIFAFLIVEGYFHTSNLKKYVGRLFLFAVLSEIPFNLMMGSSIFYPVHQNVLWTFLIAIGLVHLNESAGKRENRVLKILVGILSVMLGYALGFVFMVDYYAAGVLTVLVFYFFRGRKWWHFFAQLLLLGYINIELLSGYMYEVDLFGHTWYFVRQSLALLALIPIWLYRGKQGLSNKGLRYLYYGFYPVHLLVLGLIQRW